MINGGKIRLRAKTLSDSRNDYAWQIDGELAHLDAAQRLTIPFAQYLLDYACELRVRSRTRRRFAIDTMDGKHIGNCSCYNLDEEEGDAELGVMIGDRDYWDKGYGSDAVVTLVNYMFRETSMTRIYLKTLESNTRARRCFAKCSFTPYECLAIDGYDFVLMELYRKQWQQQQEEAP